MVVASAGAAVAVDRVVVFTKPAVPGTVKTRLAPRLGYDGAARLHQAFLDDVLATLDLADLEVVIAWASQPTAGFPTGPWRHCLQGEGDLGARMWRVLAREAADGAVVAALGSDHPDFDPQCLLEGFARVREHGGVAVGPAADGGYWTLVANRESLRPELFEGIAWSTSAVLATTLERCGQQGFAVALLAELEDCDTPEDLDRLVARLERATPSVCSATRLALAQLGVVAGVAP